jgi:hypothetical protein
VLPASDRRRSKRHQLLVTRPARLRPSDNVKISAGLRLVRTVRSQLVRSWARRRLYRDDAVILDTETSDMFGHVFRSGSLPSTAACC